MGELDQIRARKSYQKAFDQALKQKIKGSGWRKYWSAVFRKEGDWFFLGEFSHLLATGRAKMSLGAKPMALDPVLWKMMKIVGNEDQPLSFRYCGAFVCRTPMFFELETAADDPANMVNIFVDFCNGKMSELRTTLGSRSYSELARKRNEASSFGTFSQTYLMALIHEGRFAEAQAFEGEVGVGFRVISREPDGETRSFSLVDAAKQYAEAQTGRPPGAVPLRTR